MVPIAGSQKYLPRRGFQVLKNRVGVSIQCILSPGQLDPQAAGAGRGGGGEQEPGGDHKQRGRGVQLR